jgi:hypothetical protein
LRRLYQIRTQQTEYLIMSVTEEDAVELFLSRRQAINLILGSAGGACAVSMTGCATLGGDNNPVSELPIATPRGTATDPNLIETVIPWEFVLTDGEMRVVAPLCDLIIPADDRSPAASAVGVPEFINEWISAPYDAHVRDRELIRWGLAWIEELSQSEYARTFGDLSEKRKRKICDPIAYREKNSPPDPLKKHARFFSRFRSLTVGGFYTTQVGRDDLQFMGNVALGEFPGPPPEVLQHLGLL